MSATGNPNEAGKAVAEFLKNYEQKETQDRFEELATVTRKECENILEKIYVKGVVHSRTKRPHSLEKKLKDMARDAEFRDWVSKDKDISKHSEMGDLAGVRIGLHLPDDVVKVSKAIEKHFELRHLFGTVTGGRDPVKDRNLDVEQHENGPWQSEDLEGNTEHWHHYGYKSWQMVGTVVTQAWGEVQHDIIYKRPAEILATPTMKRMIDGINGLAITTEIMLRELARSLEVAKEEAQRLPFGDGEEFSKWFQSTYIAAMRPEEREHWVSSPEWADLLIQLSGISQGQLWMWRTNLTAGRPRNWEMALEHTNVKQVRRLIPCRAELAQFIKEKKLVPQSRKKPGQVFDIARLLLEALGYKLKSS